MHERSTVLIVDDDPRMCDSVKALLRHQGYDLNTCNSGNKAVEYIEKNAVDLVLLDMMMPDMDGHQIMDFLGQRRPETLVIVITGHASMESAIKSMKRGAYDYIRKPFDPDELLATVEHALDHKKLKDENAILNGKLELSEERYRYLVQSSPDIIYTLDEKGNFKFINRAVERLLNFKIEQLIGKHYTSIIYEEDLEKAKWFFNERRTGDRTATGIKLRLKVGSEGNGLKHYEVRHITIELKSNGIYDTSPTEKDKRFLGTYGVARDISDRKRLEDQLQQARKMEAIATLAGGIAHEFNNALVGILGNLELLQVELPAIESITKYSETMRDSIHRMAHLTNQLLAYAQGGKYHSKIISLNDFLKDTLLLLKHDINPSIRVETDLSNDTHPIEADITQMQMVLSALINNAVEAMEGKGRILIATRNEEVDENFAKDNPHLKLGPYVRLTVDDDGKGMDEESRQRVFDPFFTTKFQGRGLGMAAVYGVVKNHNGWVSVDSELGKWTTVHIYLPAIEGHPEESDVPKMESVKGSGTILVIEDEEMVMDVSREVLETLNYRVLGAKIGEEAIHIARSFDGDIDLAILDIVLPDMGGKAIYPRLMEARPNLKVIVCSGYSINGPAQDILDAGAQDFIQKPYTIATISRKIKEVMEGSRRET
ncbi:MAG: response regulator [Deltaproteobacteria bacterium]|nr:response regulator [Deltaproteobacteria bacterium]